MLTLVVERLERATQLIAAQQQSMLADSRLAVAVFVAPVAVVVVVVAAERLTFVLWLD